MDTLQEWDEQYSRNPRPQPSRKWVATHETRKCCGLSVANRSPFRRYPSCCLDFIDPDRGVSLPERYRKGTDMIEPRKPGPRAALKGNVLTESSIPKTVGGEKWESTITPAAN